MADKTSGLVARQWEAPTTVTTSLGVIDRLISLNKAASQDDVQPQAVIALENLGFLCLVSPDLISEGIDALNGNESVRLKDSKVLIGLSNGGTASLLRNSTSCLQGFLLITALEICGYNEKEAGEILFCMMTHADLLKKYAVSRRQLQTLVGVISGHCQHFVSGSGAETLSMILDSTASINLKAAHWNRLSHDAIARVFVKVFNALQDEDIDFIEISGCTGLVWMTLSLLWLNKDNVALFDEGNCILGQAKGKIRILFRHSDHSIDTKSGCTEEKQGGWECKTWRSGQSLPQLVEIRDESAFKTRIDSLTMIPARSTRNYYLAVFESHEVVEALGAAAVGFVRAALQVNRSPGGRRYLRQSFASMVSKRPLENKTSDESSMLKNLGWTTKFSAPCSLAITIHNSFSQCVLNKCPGHEMQSSPQDRVERHLLDIIRKSSEVPRSDSFFAEFVQACLSLAAQTFLSLFIRPVLSSSDFIGEAESETVQNTPIFFDARRDFRSFWANTMRLPVSGKDSNYMYEPIIFRDALFRAATGSRSTLRVEERGRPVAVTAGGRTAILAPLCESLVEKVGIMDVCVIPGNIYFNNTHFEVVNEDFEAEGDTKTTSSSQVFEKDSRRWKVIHDFAEDETALLMRTSIDFRSPSMQPLPVSYAQCIDRIAGSVSLSRSTAVHPSIMIETVTSDDIYLYNARSIAQMVVRQIYETFSHQAIVGGWAPHFADISFTRDPPLQIYSAGPITPEILFFSTHTHFLPPTTILILLEDFKIEESSFNTLRTILLKEFAFEEMSRNVGVKLEKLKLKELIAGIVEGLPGLRFMRSARA